MHTVQQSPLHCNVCEHDHQPDGACECGCQAKMEEEQFCPACAHAEHAGRECNCGCPG